MANLRNWLMEAEQRSGETIIAMVVGKHDDAPGSVPVGRDENIILSREAGLAKVDQEYYDGHGGVNCFPLYAWTETRVYAVHEYDGATSLVWFPRHPVAIEPSFGGQYD